eukprot:12698835-Alexandrium_andersonii.AAC.1
MVSIACRCLTCSDCCEIAGTAPCQCQNRTRREQWRRMGPERALGSVVEPIWAVSIVVAHRRSQ